MIFKTSLSQTGRYKYAARGFMEYNPCVNFLALGCMENNPEKISLHEHPR